MFILTYYLLLLLFIIKIFLIHFLNDFEKSLMLALWLHLYDQKHITILNNSFLF